MAFRFETASSEMVRKLIGSESELANMTTKDYILKTFNSMEGLKNRAAQTGNWQAKGHLSLVYRDGIPGLNVEKHLDSAIGWMESSIEHGNPVPSDICELGTMYDLKGTTSYQRKAYEMYLKAAPFGVVRAELNLAEIYRCGVEGVVTEDLEEAFKWYRRAAGEEKVDLDEAAAGEGISREMSLMRGTLRRLGIDTKIKALRLLHEYYMSGECPEGKPQPLKAIYYLKRAAEIGDIESQKELGLTYLTGVSEVPKDLEKAKRWLRKAASHGSIEAKEIMEKFDQQRIVEAAANPQPEPDEQGSKSSWEQYLDIHKRKVVDQNKHHPYLIENPLIYNESMFTQFPESPTAQHYLKAFKLTKEGLDKLHEGSFKEGVRLMAHGYLYENTILKSFPETHMPKFQPSVVCKIFEELQVDGNFYEGLLLMIALHSTSVEAPTHNLGSYKIDFKRTMFLNNLIYLIEKYEPGRLPKQNPYNFEEDYSSWLHLLYYYLGSHHTIVEQYDDGAQAFEKALQCCPTYFEAKAGLAYCLMYISFEQRTMDKNKTKQECIPEGGIQKQQSRSYENERVPECSYLRWTQDRLKEKAKQTFLEYLQEAPICDKKYPNCNYHLAFLYLSDENIQKAFEWKEKGEDAEEKRLPFLQPDSANSKQLLIALDMLPMLEKFRKCSNKENQVLVN